MNMQAMLKQAQTLQKKMMEEQELINNSTFYGDTELVKVTVKGNKRIEKIEFKNVEEFSKDDLEVLEDMIVVAINDALSQIDKETEAKLGKYTKGMPGLF